MTRDTHGPRGLVIGQDEEDVRALGRRGGRCDQGQTEKQQTHLGHVAIEARPISDVQIRMAILEGIAPAMPLGLGRDEGGTDGAAPSIDRRFYFFSFNPARYSMTSRSWRLVRMLPMVGMMETTGVLRTMSAFFSLSTFLSGRRTSMCVLVSLRN